MRNSVKTGRAAGDVEVHEQAEDDRLEPHRGDQEVFVCSRSEGSATTSETRMPDIDASRNEISRSCVTFRASRRGDVGAHAINRRLRNRDQAGVADEQIERDRERRVDRDQRADIDDIFHQSPAERFSPNRPLGLNSRTAIRIAKDSASCHFDSIFQIAMFWIMPSTKPPPAAAATLPRPADDHRDGRHQDDVHPHVEIDDADIEADQHRADANQRGPDDEADVAQPPGRHTDDFGELGIIPHRANCDAETGVAEKRKQPRARARRQTR